MTAKDIQKVDPKAQVPGQEVKRKVLQGAEAGETSSKLVTKSKKGKVFKSLWLKEIVLGVVDLALVLSTVFLVGRLQERAQEFKKARTASISASTKSRIELAGLEIAASEEKATRLSNLFPNQAGLINFVKEIDALREEGLVTSFAFASEKALRDKTGHFGIPVVIEFRGGWVQIGLGLKRLNEIPFLLRTFTIEAERTGEENLIIFKYGGFLYVDPILAEN